MIYNEQSTGHSDIDKYIATAKNALATLLEQTKEPGRRLSSFQRCRASAALSYLDEAFPFPEGTKILLGVSS
jgi:hypothetical protein